MIETLSIRGLAVIGDLDLSFGSGMTVMTGETGAGKTMLLHAISLLRGQKADVERVAPGRSEMTVEAVFALPEDAVSSRLREALEQTDAATDDGALIVRRVIRAEGRGSASIGGRSAPLSVVADVTDELVAIHGQHSARQLARTEVHRQLLDEYAGAAHLQLLAECASAHLEHKAAMRALEEARSRSAADALVIGSLQALVDDVTALDVGEGEDVQLRERSKDAQDLLERQEALVSAVSVLDADSDASVLPLLGRVTRLLGGSHGAVADAAALIASAAAQLQEAASLLSRQADRVEDAAAELDRIQLRRQQISTMVRKHGAGDVADLLARFAQAQEVLSAAIAPEDLEKLQAQCEQTHAAARSKAAALTDSRRGAAVALAEDVNARLLGLGFAFAGFDVRIAPTEPSSTGVDVVEFTLSSRSGAPAVSLATSASGGEMSRVSLAITTAMAANAPVMPALVFDEVDAGIGGDTAHAVATQLRALAEHTQVVIVTHSAQIAAVADDHWLVAATPSGARVSRLADEDARVDEICRMMGTDRADSSARDVAVSMLGRAVRGKVAPAS